MKIEVKIDLEDFIERWGDDSLEQAMQDTIKYEVIKKLKESDGYKELVNRRYDELLKTLPDAKAKT